MSNGLKSSGLRQSSCRLSQSFTSWVGSLMNIASITTRDLRHLPFLAQKCPKVREIARYAEPTKVLFANGSPSLGAGLGLRRFTFDCAIRNGTPFAQHKHASESRIKARLKMTKLETMDGNEAVARVVYAASEVIAIYPITLGSPWGSSPILGRQTGRPTFLVVFLKLSNCKVKRVRQALCTVHCRAVHWRPPLRPPRAFC